MHAGDCFVILSGIILGPLAGGLSAGIGSMFADLFLGYALYAPGTFLIKFLAALLSGLVFCALKKQTEPFKKIMKHKLFPVLLSGIASSLIVIGGYFLYDWMITGSKLAGAVAGILGNLLQGGVSILLSALFYTILPKTQWENIKDAK